MFPLKLTALHVLASPSHFSTFSFLVSFSVFLCSPCPCQQVLGVCVRGGGVPGPLFLDPPLGGKETRQEVRSQSSGPSCTTDLGPGESPLSLSASVFLKGKMGIVAPPPEYLQSCDSFKLNPNF